MLADALHQRLFFDGTVGHKKLSVEYHHLKLRQFCPQTGRNGLRLFHGIDDHARTAALPQGTAQSVSQLFLGQRECLHSAWLGFQWDSRLLHPFAVRPGQQRVAPAGLPRAVRSSSSIQVGSDQLDPALGGQGSGKQDHRHFVPAQPGQRPVKIAVHVSVIGVALVNDHHLARKAKVAQHHMFLL